MNTPRESKRARLGGLGTGLGSTLLALALPKCPLCAAAYLSVFGLGAGAAGLLISVLRPLLIAVALAALAFSLKHWLWPARRCCLLSRAPSAHACDTGQGRGAHGAEGLKCT